MNRVRGVSALAAMLVLNILLAFALTPLGFESRPPTQLTTMGFVAIGAVVAGVVLDLVSLLFLFRRTRLAAALAIIGSILFLVPNVVDRTGSFFTVPIPAVVSTLEYIFIAVLFVTLFMASSVYRATSPTRS